MDSIRYFWEKGYRMKFTFIYVYFVLSIALIFFLMISCQGNSDGAQKGVSSEPGTSESAESQAVDKEPATRSLNKAFKSYWYSGQAEVNTYELEQARYGELRQGHAVLVFVTEPFLRDQQVKADLPLGKQVSVLKLNATKKFLTGIYPYSVMESTFSPATEKAHAIKSTLSVQEWCGQVYVQVNNRNRYEVTSHSYFQSEGDREFVLDLTYMESDLWNRIRLAPDELPTGDITVVPSLEFTRLKHRKIQAYRALARIEEDQGEQVYTLEYPELKRSLSIRFSKDFPHTISGWEESYPDGYGEASVLLTSRGRLKISRQLPYWKLNSNADLIYRDSIGLAAKP